MNNSIARKLFASHLGLTLVVLFTTLLLARWSFNQGFSDYINALEERRLRALAEELAPLYNVADNSWEALTQEKFSELEFRSFPSKRNRQKATSQSNSQPRPPPGHKRPPPPHRPPPHIRTPPTALFDNDGNLLAGHSDTRTNEAAASRVSVTVDDTIVGVLISAPRRDFTSPPETRFQRQQLINSGVTAVSMLLLAILVSLLLTRVLARPLKKLAGGIRQLSDGHYAHRLLSENDSTPSNDELANLMTDLDRLAGTLDKNQSSRQRWLADIAHELRTPLTILVGDIAALKDGVRKFDNEQLNILDHSANRLHRLVEDLHQLAISDVGGLRYRFESVDIGELARHSCESFKRRSAHKLSIEVHNDKPVLVRGDTTRLSQLLDNLLVNAEAYTDAPGKIVIHVSATDHTVLLRIDDTAPTVSEDACEKLFEPLYRTESSRSRHSAGAGLGLAICQNIAHAHHGDIQASISPHGGVRIEVRIPASTTTQEQET